MNFYKYQGTGNDFILINNMNQEIKLTEEQIKLLCDRHFGIGSDGLILLEPDKEADFQMVFYNPDASMSFCGNGSRCAVRFAKDQGIIDNQCHFRAIDGMHSGRIIDQERVAVRMKQVEGAKILSSLEYFIHTGSPHHLVFTENLDRVDFIDFCKNIRYNPIYAPGGTNVNLVLPISPNFLKMRTYERGVENETLSCGTGVTAAAIGLSIQQGLKDGNHSIGVETRGGTLEVQFEKEGLNFTSMDLIGPAVSTFQGTIEL